QRYAGLRCVSRRKIEWLHSLACSCRLNGINSFDYFKDILNKFIEIKPNTDKKVIRELLPDKWKK
ncbi:transposase domain-containing protein, partial [Bacteroides caecimuris]